MSPPTKLLMVFVDETDMWKEVPLYEAIVRRLVHLEVAGATVQAGVMGYGAHGRVHRKRLFGVSDDRPIVIYAVDNEEKLRKALPEIRPMVREGLMVLADVEVLS